MAWALTRGLQHLRDQVNEAFPDRDTKSDGTIGDAAHQAGTSGHNPDDSPGNKGRPEWNSDSDSSAEVRAWDMDSDLRMPGVTTQEVVDHLRHLPGVSSVLRYMIYNHKIYRASNGWKAETYDGPSPHTEHIHFTGAYSQAADNNTSFDYRLEDLVGLSSDDIAKIRNIVTEVVNAKLTLNPFQDKLKGVGSSVGNSAWSHGFPIRPGAERVPAWQGIQDLSVRIDAIQQMVAQLVENKPKP